MRYLKTLLIALCVLYSAAAAWPESLSPQEPISQRAAALALAYPQTLREAGSLFGLPFAPSSAWYAGKGTRVGVCVVLSDAASADLWLAGLQAAASSPAEQGMLFIVDPGIAPVSEAFVSEFEPGIASWKEGALPELLRDFPEAIVLLLAGGTKSAGYALESAAQGRQSPYWALSAAREAAARSGLALAWSANASFLAHSGIFRVGALLEPWLEAGLSALVLRPPAGQDGGVLSRPETELFISFLSELSGSAAASLGADAFDTNYLLLPLGGRAIHDRHIAGASLALFGLVCLTLSLIPNTGLLAPAGKKRVSGPLRESLLSFLIAAFAFGAAALAAAGSLALSGADAEALRSFGQLKLIALLTLRLVAFFAAYYALSGFLERAGILAHATRTTAAKAASLSFALLGLFALAGFPSVAPFAFVCALATAVAAFSGIGSGFFLAAALSVAGFLVLPIFIGQYPELSVAFLYGDAAGVLGQALFFAPFALWLGASVSSRSRMRRGAKPAPYLALALPLAFIAELLLLRLG
jgi:hypothetical protein